MIDNLKEVITNNFEETFNLGREFSENLSGGEVLCLEGDLGAGKTTFTQGVLSGLGVADNVNSPTFVIIKEYSLSGNEIKNVYHIDTYRVESNDIIDLGWENISGKRENIVIVEWPEKIKEIIPQKSIWIKFEYLDQDKRKINFYYEKN